MDEKEDLAEAVAVAETALGSASGLMSRMVDECSYDIGRACVLVAKALKAGRKVLACGNGGSAAQAEHLVAELMVRMGEVRYPLPAVALSGNSALVTAHVNDLGIEGLFARQVQGLGQVGDVLIAISTSGRSVDVVEAARAARRAGMDVVALTGAEGSDLAKEADVVIPVPHSDTARIQEVHLVVCHIICQYAERHLEHGSTPGSQDGEA